MAYALPYYGYMRHHYSISITLHYMKMRPHQLLLKRCTDMRELLVNINVYSKTVLYYMWKEIDTK